MTNFENKNMQLFSLAQAIVEKTRHHAGDNTSHHLFSQKEPCLRKLYGATLECLCVNSFVRTPKANRDSAHCGLD